MSTTRRERATGYEVAEPKAEQLRRQREWRNRQREFARQMHAGEHMEERARAAAGDIDEHGIYHPPCPTGKAIVDRTCITDKTKGQAANVLCGDILCKRCERKRIAIRQEKWGARLDEMEQPKHIVWTLRNTDTAQGGIDALSEAMRALKQARNGAATRKRMQRDLEARHARAIENATHDKIMKANKTLASELQFIRWLADREQQRRNKAVHDGAKYQPEKFGAIMEGLGCIEMPPGKSGQGWHPHLHAIIEAEFIPNGCLSWLWQRASKGQGRITFIRQAHDSRTASRELLKYISKPASVKSFEQAEELREAMHGRKRIRVFGKIKPDPIKSKPCPFCHQTGCKGTIAGIASNAHATIPNVDYPSVAITRDGETTLHRVIISRGKHCEEFLIIIEADETEITPQELGLSQKFLSESREGRANPLTGPPTGPPLGQYDELHTLEGIQWALR